ncbi:MAG: hypothetical protein ACOC9B_06060, partial [Chloroflexota bacterium]
MAKTKKHKWTAAEVIDLLRKRYDKAGNGNSKRYVFIEQVAPATGFSHKSTWIDAMVFSMWPSEGLNREAFEVKVSRQDFLGEINDPYKNAWFKGNSHKFWYVTAPGVVKTEDEVPEGCGWMLAQTGRLVIKKQATHQRIKSEIDAEFFASVARAMDREKDEARRRMRSAVLDEPELKHALDTSNALQRWFQKQGVIPSDKKYQTRCWETPEELEDILGRALAGEGDANLADVIEERVRLLRDKIGEMLVMLTPYAAELLSDIEHIGHFTRSYMNADASFNILEDLMKKPDKYSSRYISDYERAERKARLRVMKTLLGAAKNA